MRGVIIPVLALSWLASVAISMPAAAAPAERCYEDWTIAAPVVAKERLVPGRDIQAGVARLTTGKVLSITLCEQQPGRFVYVVKVLEAGGKLRTITLDARRPFQ